MAGGTFSPKGRRSPVISEINVTPLVDVVLVLLVILMVSSTYIVSQSMKVELPRAASTDGVTQSPITITLLVSGGLQYNREPAEEKEIRDRLKAALSTNPELPVVVSADKAVPHGRVVSFVDLARLAGAKRFAINVEHRN
jgi:biopolymer transport protein ExbD